MLLVGLLSVVAGVIILAKPGDSLATLAVIAGIFLLADGILELAVSLLHSTQSRGIVAVLGVITAIAGVLLDPPSDPGRHRDRAADRDLADRGRGGPRRRRLRDRSASRLEPDRRGCGADRRDRDRLRSEHWFHHARPARRDRLHRQRHGHVRAGVEHARAQACGGSALMRCRRHPSPGSRTLPSVERVAAVSGARWR